MIRSIVVCLALVLSLPACREKLAEKQGHVGWKTAGIEVAGIPLKVEIADNNQTRTVGLMYRDTLPEDAGMLFVFDAPEPQGFWMKNTRVPLSIAFVDESGTVLEIHDMERLDETVTHSVSDRVKYAIEVNRGWFSRHGVGPGAKVKGL